MIDELKKFLADKKVPATLLIVAALGGWWCSKNVVLAEDLNRYQTGVERRILLQQKQQLEFEVFKLETQKDVQPAKFDEFDNRLLIKQQQQLNEVKDSLKAIK